MQTSLYKFKINIFFKFMSILGPGDEAWKPPGSDSLALLASLASISAFSTDLKRTQTLHTLFRDFGAD